MASKNISVGNYLLRRLHEAGITDMFGVPGDFNLEFLDLVEDDPKIRWVGGTNELNAAYSADGYARIRGMAALVTTFGVGELSAMNGVSGSYSEMLPVVHIVGTPSRQSQDTGAILHHSLGNGDFRVFERMYTEVTVGQTTLTPENAIVEVDRVLDLALRNTRPVYISLPTDVAYLSVVGTVPKGPFKIHTVENDPEVEAEVIKAIVSSIKKSKKPIIMVDCCALRQRAMKEVRALIEASGLPVYAAPMGKAGVPETHPQFRGIYLGASTPSARTKAEVEEADFCLNLGAVHSDFNSGGFTYRVPRAQTVELHTRYSRVFHAIYEGVGMKRLLPKLTEAVRGVAGKVGVDRFAKTPVEDPTWEKGSDTSAISQAFLWPELSKHFARGDIVVAETGTSSFGILGSRFPEGTDCLTQVLWGSIGWSVGAAIGATIAAPDRRVLLLVGDGSFQLTGQELSTAARHNLKIVTLLLNNDGYTIERLIRGPKRVYNDVQMWNYDRVWDFVGGKGHARKVTTRAELTKALGEAASPRESWMIEVGMGLGRLDAPVALNLQIEAGEKSNVYGIEED